MVGVFPDEEVTVDGFSLPSNCLSLLWMEGIRVWALCRLWAASSY